MYYASHQVVTLPHCARGGQNLMHFYSIHVIAKYNLSTDTYCTFLISESLCFVLILSSLQC